MRVYEKVRAYIDEQGLKQTTVAQKADIPIATFHAILSGKRVMYAEELRAICLALNVSPETFVEHTLTWHGSRSNRPARRNAGEPFDGCTDDEIPT